VPETRRVIGDEVTVGHRAVVQRERALGYVRDAREYARAEGR